MSGYNFHVEMISKLKDIDNWAEEKEYEYVYYLGEIDVQFYFYNSPLYRGFTCQVNDATDPLNQIQKAFENR